MNYSPSVFRPLLYIALALAAVTAVIWWRNSAGHSSEGTSFPAEDAPLTPLGEPHPDWRLRPLDGEEVRLGDYRGRVVFLNIWATWCGPCVAEIPSIQHLHDALKDEGVVFLLASAESPGRVKEFVDHKKWHVPVFTFTPPPPAVFETEGIPATFILDRQGQVVFQQVGSTDWDSEDCRRFLRRLAKERPR